MIEEELNLIIVIVQKMISFVCKFHNCFININVKHKLAELRGNLLIMFEKGSCEKLDGQGLQVQIGRGGRGNRRIKKVNLNQSTLGFPHFLKTVSP
jgi:hypothetical protein